MYSKKPQTKITGKLIALTTLAVVGGFLFGYDTGVVTGAVLYLKVDFGMIDWQEEWVVTATLVGAAVFSLVGGLCNEYFGRKPVIMASSVLFVCGSVALALAPRTWYPMLLCGRAIVGIAIGLSSSTVPSYVSEASPPSFRGYMLTMFQLSIGIGFWIAAIIDAAFSYVTNPNLNWRFMLGIAAIPAAIQFIGFIFMDESPRWLATHGKLDEAKTVLIKLNGNSEDAITLADEICAEIRLTQELAEKEKERLGSGPTLFLMLQIPTVRKALIIGCLLQVFQQLCGINTIMYYSATIVNMAGIGNYSMDIWMAVVTSSLNFPCSFVGIYLVEKIGRRSLLLVSILGVFVMSLLMAGGFILIASDSPYSNFTEIDSGNDTCAKIQRCDLCSYQEGCGFCLLSNNTAGACVSVLDFKNLTQSNTQWANYGRCAPSNFDNPIYDNFKDPDVVWDYGFCPTAYSWVPILAMVLYLNCFSLGFGSMPWTINAEIYPNWARSTGNACSTFSNWFCNIFVGLYFLTLADAITRQGIYFLFAGVTLTGFVLFYLILPETKDKKIEEIEQLLDGPWITRGKASPVKSKNINNSTALKF